MKTFLNVPFLICIAIFFMFHIAEIRGSQPGFLASYLDDFLAMPIILTAILALHRILIYQNSAAVLPKKHIVFSIMFVSLLFEFILPHFGQKYTSDPFDILAYIFGAIVFEIAINKPILV